MNDIERSIINCLNESIAEAVKSRLVSYNSPINSVIDSVVAAQGDLIRVVVAEAFSQALTGDLKEGLRTALAHKLAKMLVSKMEGEIEKRVNDLRSNPTTRAAIILAVEGAISRL